MFIKAGDDSFVGFEINLLGYRFKSKCRIKNVIEMVLFCWYLVIDVDIYMRISDVNCVFLLSVEL